MERTERENGIRMIFVDTRGTGEKEIAEELRNKRITVECKYLESGDYVISQT